jgi:prolipoprotein diacylglyceryl transferase
VTLADFPSPTQSVWHIPLFGGHSIPLRAYALCIVLGIVVAAVITDRRMRSRGVPEGFIYDVAILAVLFGILGARLYHVFTTPEPYFGKDGSLIDILKVYNGGLGIWGAVVGGAFGVWLACRWRGIQMGIVADSLAPGLPLAQAIGRWGNYFNNELFGKHTDLPWGLRVYNMIDGKATVVNGSKEVPGGPFHPAFLYESLWDLGTAVLVFALDRKYKFGRGRAFAVYVMAYTVGRFWIEALRIDEAHTLLGLRLNDWTSIIVFVGALIYFIRVKGDRQYHAGATPSGAISLDGSAPASPPSAEPDQSPASEPPGGDNADPTDSSDSEDDEAARR